MQSGRGLAVPKSQFSNSFFIGATLGCSNNASCHWKEARTSELRKGVDLRILGTLRGLGQGQQRFALPFPASRLRSLMHRFGFGTHAKENVAFWSNGRGIVSLETPPIAYFEDGVQTGYVSGSIFRSRPMQNCIAYFEIRIRINPDP